MGVGERGSKVFQNFSENSSVLVPSPVPKNDNHTDNNDIINDNYMFVVYVGGNWG